MLFSYSSPHASIEHTLHSQTHTYSHTHTTCIHMDTCTHSHVCANMCTSRHTHRGKSRLTEGTVDFIICHGLLHRLGSSSEHFLFLSLMICMVDGGSSNSISQCLYRIWSSLLVISLKKGITSTAKPVLSLLDWH